MGRLVRKPKAAEVEQQDEGLDGMLRGGLRGAPAASTAAIPGDNYVERIAKYVPAEVIGASLVVNSILQQAVVAGGATATMAGFPVTDIAAGALVIATFMTPLFCWYVQQDGDAWIVNAVVSTVAFPFWAYLMGAVAFSKFHDGNLATILILTFTVVSGLVTPVARRPRKRAQQKSNQPLEGPRLVEALTA